MGKTFSTTDEEIKPLGLDAKVAKKGSKLPKLVIMVVGEAVRADHLSYNGYERETTPLLKKENISFQYVPVQKFNKYQDKKILINSYMHLSQQSHSKY